MNSRFVPWASDLLAEQIMYEQHLNEFISREWIEPDADHAELNGAINEFLIGRRNRIRDTFGPVDSDFVALVGYGGLLTAENLQQPDPKDGCNPRRWEIAIPLERSTSIPLDIGLVSALRPDTIVSLCGNQPMFFQLGSPKAPSLNSCLLLSSKYKGRPAFAIDFARRSELDLYVPREI